MFDENESMLPLKVSKHGREDEPLDEVIFCDSISGGADYEKNMPKRLSIVRRVLDGKEYRGEYSLANVIIDEWTYKLQEMYLKTDGDKLSASEALYGFCAWLSIRKNSITISQTHDAAPVADLVQQFIKTNNLSDPREGWEKNLTHPK